MALTCDTLGVSRSGFYAWLTRTPCKRCTENEQLGRAVHHSFIQSDRTYGARRVWHDLLASDYHCGLHRVERLMQAQALWARPRRRSLPIDRGERPVIGIAANVLDRQFDASAPNRK